MISVTAESPLTADSMDLIAGSEAELAALYPPEERFALSPQQLIDGDVYFVVLRDGGTSLGCGGLAPYPDYGELKRIYVVPERRGQGHAHRILNALEAHGRELCLPVVRLETGMDQAAALALYHSRGYLERPAFGDYADTGASLFMELAL